MDRLFLDANILFSAAYRPIAGLVQFWKLEDAIFCSSHYAVEESRYQLEKEYNVQTSYLRLRSYPFNQDLLDFIRRHDRVYVVDQNRDAQILQLMRLEFDPADIAKLRSMRYYGGLPLDARTVTDDIVRQEGI